MSLLFNRKPIVINAELADRIGLNEAIVLQQLNYWIQDSTAGEVHDGRKWVYNTFEEWQRDNFPFWSVDTIKRTLTKLKKLGLVDVKQLRKSKHDHTNFYTIEYRHALLSDQGNLHQSNGADCANPSEQNAPAVKGKKPRPNGAKCTDLHTETTTETTSETLTGGEKSPPAAGGLPAVLSSQQQSSQEEHKEPSYEKIRTVFWERFDPAYAQRYAGAVLPRNTKINSLVKQLITRLGKEAPAVAVFYVTSVNEPRATMSQHSLDVLVKNAEGYRTQWFTGRAMTNTRARQLDQTQANANAADEAIRMLREREGRE
ncbi:transcriptional regulator [Klebsiella phage vB_KpnP_ZX1]|nr:transcriptional regulator [Klebsiella phage vB_KpnP_ZX1]